MLASLLSLPPARPARRPGWHFVAATGVAVALILASARPCSAQDPALTVGIVPLRIGPKIPASRESLEKMVQRGLAILAAPLVEAPEAAARLKVAGATVPCEDSSCWMAAGRAVGVRYLVAGDVQLKDGFFEVQFDLIDATSGRVLATEPNRCEAADCSVAELCRLTVRELTRQTLGPTLPVAGAEPAPVRAPTVGSPSVAASPASDSSRTDHRAGRFPWRTAIAAVGITGGIVSLVTGGFYLAQHGDCANADCTSTRNTLWGGLAWEAGGVAAIATGILIAWPQRADRDPEPASSAQLRLWPGGISVSGRF